MVPLCAGLVAGFTAQHDHVHTDLYQLLQRESQDSGQNQTGKKWDRYKLPSEAIWEKSSVTATKYRTKLWETRGTWNKKSPQEITRQLWLRVSDVSICRVSQVPENHGAVKHLAWDWADGDGDALVWSSCPEHPPWFSHTTVLHSSPKCSCRRPQSCSLPVMQMLLRGQLCYSIRWTSPGAELTSSQTQGRAGQGSRVALRTQRPLISAIFKLGFPRDPHPARHGAAQKWDKMCPETTWQRSSKPGLDPTTFISSPRHLVPPLHTAVG